jgi:hypothetical protein
MKTFTALAAAGLLAVSTMGSALACSAHPEGHTADAGKPVATADAPVMTPKPKTGG